jgi:hypothetical protein
MRSVSVRLVPPAILFKVFPLADKKMALSFGRQRRISGLLFDFLP